jgi:amino acid adenylation domain-containing protein
MKRLKDLPPAKRALFMQMMQKQAALTESAHHIPRRPPGDSAPLSFAQQRLWLMDQLMPGAALYNIPVAVRLTGVLDASAMEACLTEVVRRHEALRTTCGVVNGEPRQVIAPPHPFELPFFDLRERVAGEKESEMRRLIAAEVGTAFDLTRGPLVRASLLRLAEAEHVLVLTMHHIVSDGWSRGVLIREVTQLYAAFSTGQPSSLPELPVQFADFAVWQRARLTDAAIEAQLAYWKQQLGGTLPVLELPADRPRPPVQTYRGATHMFLIPRRTSDDLRRLAREEEATLFMALLAVFQLLLRRYTGQQDISVGTPVAGRDRTELEGLIGLFVNTLVMRTDLSGDPTFRQLLSRTRETALGAFSNQDVQFERLVEELRPERDMSRTPLFQAMFMLQNAPPSGISKLRGLSVEPLQIASVTAKFDVTFSFGETDDGLRGTLEYSSDLFDHATMERFASHFHRLAEEVAANPDEKISALPMLALAERRQLLEEFNDTRRDYARDLTLVELFEQQVARTPEHVALIAGDESLTYAELNARAERLARHLRELGVTAESLVGVCTERTPAMVIALLGVLKAGGAYLPLDPAYPAERLSYMLEDAGVRVLLTQRRLSEMSHPRGAVVLYLDEPRWREAASDDWQPATPTTRTTRPENLAYVIYTSGSTGQPKGVAVTHRALANFLHSMQREPGVTGDDTLVAVTSLSFDIAALELYLPLICGARLVLASREEAADAPRLQQLLTGRQATVMQATPATWRMLADAGWRHDGSLKLLCGGEALPRDLADRLIEGGAPVWNLYGPTETTIWSTLKQISQAERAITIGRPIDNTHIYVLDEHLRPVALNVAGDLYIGGDGLARGYLNRPDLTAERFIPDPHSTEAGARLYLTGDVARWRAGGEIEFLGRSDQQVKVRGFRIELGEVEAAVCAEAGVRQCVAVVRETEATGDQRLVAYVVAGEGASAPSSSELRAALRGRLPEYMVPSAVVVVDELPLTPNGKVDRKALRESDLAGEGSVSEYVARSTPTEEMLANVWAGVLGVEQVGAGDNFFDLGGHSLLATQVISQVRQIFQVEVAMRDLFETPTVAGLAARVERLVAEGGGIESAPLVRVTRDGALPLSFAQQRLWFIDQLMTGQPLYHVPTTVRLRGPLDAGVFEQCLAEIVRRHETLRTSFPTVGGEPVQLISPAQEAWTLPLIDLSDLPESEQTAEINRLTSEDARRPFDLARGPVMRTTLARLGAEDHVVLFTLHHIASDGWSMGVLINEVATLYAAFVEGRQSPLPELPIQYADFAVWQREWLTGEVMESQLAYWREQLGEDLPVLELPADRPRPAIQTHRGATQMIVLPATLSEKLKTLSRREGATLFMTLLAAFQTLLFRHSGQEEIVVGTDIANRRRKEVEGLIGFFVNQLVLRTSLAGDPTFRELLGRVREVALGAYAHQDLPFDKLVQALEPERDLSRSPLFQAKLVLQNAPHENLELTDLSMSFIEIESGTTPFDFLLAMRDGREGLIGQLNYSTDLFDDATIVRFLERFRDLLAQVADAPDARLSSLRVLSEEEAGGLAPSDFPEAELSRQDFENLLAALGDVSGA